MKILPFKFLIILSALVISGCSSEESTSPIAEPSSDTPKRSDSNPKQQVGGGSGGASPVYTEPDIIPPIEEKLNETDEQKKDRRDEIAQKLEGRRVYFEGESVDDGVVSIKSKVVWKGEKIVNDQHRIEQGGVLIIEPGTKVIFGPKGTIHVAADDRQNEKNASSAALIAKGTSALPIQFVLSGSDATETAQNVVDIASSSRANSLVNIDVLADVAEGQEFPWDLFVVIRDGGNLSNFENISWISTGSSTAIHIWAAGTLRQFRAVRMYGKLSEAPIAAVLGPSSTHSFLGPFQVAEDSKHPLRPIEKIDVELTHGEFPSETPIRFQSPNETQIRFTSFGHLQSWSSEQMIPVTGIEAGPNVQIMMDKSETLYAGVRPLTLEGSAAFPVVITTANDQDSWGGVTIHLEGQSEFSFRHVLIKNADVGFQYSSDHGKSVASASLTDRIRDVRFQPRHNQNESDRVRPIVDASSQVEMGFDAFDPEVKVRDFQGNEVGTSTQVCDLTAIGDLAWQLYNEKLGARAIEVLGNSSLECIWGRAALDLAMTDHAEVDAYLKAQPDGSPTKINIEDIYVSKIARPMIRTRDLRTKMDLVKAALMMQGRFGFTSEPIAKIYFEGSDELKKEMETLIVEFGPLLIPSLVEMLSEVSGELQEFRGRTTTPNEFGIVSFRNDPKKVRALAKRVFGLVGKGGGDTINGLITRIDQHSKAMEISTDRKAELSLFQTWLGRALVAQGTAALPYLRIPARHMRTTGPGSNYALEQYVNAVERNRQQGGKMTSGEEDWGRFIGGKEEMKPMSVAFGSYSEITARKSLYLIGAMMQPGNPDEAREEAARTLMRMAVPGSEDNPRGDWTLQMWVMEVFGDVGRFPNLHGQNLGEDEGINSDIKQMGNRLIGRSGEFAIHFGRGAMSREFDRHQAIVTDAARGHGMRFLGKPAATAWAGDGSS